MSLTTTTFWAGKPPKRTAVAPVKPLPVTVTLVPPVVGPELGETEVTAGAGVVPPRKGCSWAQLKTMLAARVGLGLTTKMAA
jgi:hypothetical protein